MQVSQRANVAARQIVREQQQHVVGARASRRHPADATLFAEIASLVLTTASVVAAVTLIVPRQRSPADSLGEWPRTIREWPPGNRKNDRAVALSLSR